jgi:2-desacetyl-2-hydroxyethyl bacteriochlorophyllide A dehydrogenase
MAVNVRSRLVFLAPGEVGLEPFESPVPGAGQLTLRTVVTAISAGTEALLWHGLWPGEMPLDGLWAPDADSARYPVAYGYASVGVIEAVGSGVPSEWVGRLAFTFTGHQSQTVATADEVLLLPAGLSAEDGVFLASMETALALAQDAAPALGETVGVWGLGSIGVLTAALLGRAFAVQAWDLSPFRRELAALFGSFTVQKPSVRSCDVAVEVTGNPAALDEALAAVRFSGRVVAGSWYGAQPVTLALGGEFHRSRIELVSSQVSTVAPALSGRWSKRRRLETVLALLGELKPSRLITHRFPLEQANEAYRQACDHPETGLQVVFTYPAVG